MKLPDNPTKFKYYNMMKNIMLSYNALHKHLRKHVKQLTVKSE